jgi:hypothetical protein
VKTPKVNTTAIENQYASALAKRKDLLLDMQTSRKQAADLNILEEDRELEAIKIKYAEKRKVIQAFNDEQERLNKKRVKKVELLSTADLDIAEQNEVDSVKDKQGKEEYEKGQALLKEFRTYSDQRIAIQKEYLDIAARLRADGHDKEASEAINRGVAEVSALDENNLRSLDSYQQLFENIEELSREQTQFHINELQKRIDADLAAGKITFTTYAKVNKQIQGASKSLKTDYVDGLYKASDALGGIANQLRDIDAGFSQFLGTISNVVGGFGDLVKQKKAFSAPGASGLDKAIAGAGIVGAGIGIVTSIFSSIAAKREESRKADVAYYQNAYSGEKEYARMMRARESIQQNITRLTLQELDARKGMLSGQNSAAQKDFDETLAKLNDLGRKGRELKDSSPYHFGGKSIKRPIDDAALLENADYKKLEELFTQERMSDGAKALFVELRKSKEELEKIGVLTKENDEVNQKIRTGTTSDTLADSLFNMIKEGKTGIQDLADFFEDTMQDAVFSTFRNNVLNKSIEEFYKKFDEASKDGLNSGEVESLSAAFNTQIKDDLAKLDTFKLATGLDFKTGQSGSSSNSLSGGIKREITEETGSILAGVFKGVQLNTFNLVQLSTQQVGLHKKSIDIAMSGIRQLEAIQINTLRTADNTTLIPEMNASLLAIKSGMNSPSNALTAGGIRP